MTKGIKALKIAAVFTLVAIVVIALAGGSLAGTLYLIFLATGTLEGIWPAVGLILWTLELIFGSIFAAEYFG